MVTKLLANQLPQRLVNAVRIEGARLHKRDALRLIHHVQRNAASRPPPS